MTMYNVCTCQINVLFCSDGKWPSYNHLLPNMHLFEQTGLHVEGVLKCELLYLALRTTYYTTLAGVHYLLR